jgi:hypothetical protein
MIPIVRRLLFLLILPVLTTTQGSAASAALADREAAALIAPPHQLDERIEERALWRVLNAGGVSVGYAFEADISAHAIWTASARRPRPSGSSMKRCSPRRSRSRAGALRGLRQGWPDGRARISSRREAPRSSWSEG